MKESEEMMKAKVQIDDKQISKMDLAITVTMTVDEWRELMRQVPDKWPSWKFGSAISKAIGHVTRATDTILDIEP